MEVSTFYLVSGLASLAYSVFAAANYYTLSGADLVSPKKAREMIRRGQIDYIIDVRTKLERDTLGYYPGSLHIPVTSFSESRFDKIPRTASVLVYCNTGQRARRAAEMLTQYGFTEVYYIAGFYKSLIQA